MEKFKFTYKNFGLIRRGYDIAKISVEFNIKDKEKMVIKFDTGLIEIKDSGYNVYKEDKINVKEVLEALSKINYPEQTQFDEGGCDGFAWEIEFDNKKYEGYLMEPDFYKESIKIINFDKIYSYCEEKVANYLN